MNKLVKLTFLLSMLFVMAQSCGGDDGPEVPAEEIRRYNSKDSIAFVEVMKAAYGPYVEMAMLSYGIDLDDISTWGVDNKNPYRPLNWRWFDDIKEYRIDYISLVKLYALGGDGYFTDGYVSEHVWDMDSLTSLWIRGDNISGSIPERHMSCPSMNHMLISDTNIDGIPDDLFSITSGVAYVFYNKNLKILPPALLENTPPLEGHDATTIYLCNNGFEGAAPVEANRSVNLTDNNFTQIDLDRLKKVDFKEKLLHLVPTVPFCSDNKISGEAPDWVLKDTLATIYTSYIVHDQKNGFGVSNLPSSEEVEKMKKEYSERHPEFKPYFTR